MCLTYKIVRCIILFSFVYLICILREGIIVGLDRRFVVYPGGAGVDEGAGVEDGGPPVFYTGSLVYTGYPLSAISGTGVDEPV